MAFQIIDTLAICLIYFFQAENNGDMLFALLALFEGNLAVSGRLRAQRAIMRNKLYGITLSGEILIRLREAYGAPFMAAAADYTQLFCEESN